MLRLRRYLNPCAIGRGSEVRANLVPSGHHAGEFRLGCYLFAEQNSQESETVYEGFGIPNLELPL